MAKFRGWKLAAICEALELKHSIKLHDAFMAEYRMVVEELFDERLEAVSGVKQALSQISLPMCVASSGPPEKIEKAQALTGLWDFFRGRVFSAYTINSWKPDPGLFLHAAKEMGAAPDQCIVVEDSEVGIKAAKSAGMQAYWFCTDKTRENIPGVVCFSEMAELPALLQIWSSVGRK